MALPTKKPAPKQQATNYVPLDQFAHGTGLLNDVDVTFTDIGFDPNWDYQGHRSETVLALVVEMTDDQGTQYVQGYSLGKTAADSFDVTEDGGALIAKKDNAMISDGSNGYLFLSSLLEAGLPPEKIHGGNVKDLIGLRCHVAQHAQPKRTWLVRESEREPTILLVTEIHELPGEGKQQKTAPKAAPARPTTRSAGAATPGKPAAAAVAPARNAATAAATASPSKPNGSAPVPGLEEVATDILLTVLSENDGQMDKSGLPPKIFAEAQKRVEQKQIKLADKTKVSGLVYKDEFLHSLVEQGAIAYEDGVLTLVQ